MVFNNHTDHIRINAPIDNRIQNQPTSTSDSLPDESMADTDEPPDPLSPTLSDLKPVPQQAQDFTKKSCALERKQSLLTQILHTSESDSSHEDENLFSDARRAHSSASTWSRGSGASTAELTSDGHTSPARAGTPSPPLPPAQLPPAPIFNQKPFESTLTIKSPPPEAISPLQKPQISSNEENVEAGLGRKRCIKFACGRKEEVKQEDPVRNDQPKPAEPAKRPCALKFVCPTRDSALPAKPLTRYKSPPPMRRLPSSPKPLTRPHRGSESAVRNDSSKTVRKVPSVVRTRKSNEDAEVDRNEATRFHEFASSEEEVDDWTQEATCHKTRLTVSDTLRVENDLRKLGTEAEEEAMDEEEELDEEVDEELEEDDDEAMSVGPVSSGYVSDEGFHSDDEEGFAGSDDDNEADSEDEWWAPGRGRQASTEPLEHIRPMSRHSNTNSSIASMDNGQAVPTPIARVSSRRRKDKTSSKSDAPELPDSTDFVCGTLDEDRPVEQAFLNALRQRQAQKHRTVPQDFDPTFPTSDLEMDEEDEESEQDILSDSEPHMFMHGNMDPHEDTMDLRGDTSTVIPRKRSPPPHSPQSRTRLRSPPPTKRVIHRSPPPPAKRVVHRSPPPPTTRRGLLFSQSPTRSRSPLPPNAVPLRSPPPTRRPSFSYKLGLPPPPTGLASRPQRGRLASSLPRDGHEYTRKPLLPLSDDEDGDNGEDNANQNDALPTRGAIDIVKGLEKKRQRRREKLFEKHCRLKEQGKLKTKDGRKCPKGMGAERMREVGLECAALRGHRRMVWRDEGGEGATHILSY